MDLPTPEFVIREGKWDARYARVLAVGGNAAFALALVDTNGDGQGIETCIFVREEDGRWQEGSSSGPVSTDVGVRGSGESAGHVLAYGRARAAGPVVTVVDGVELEAEANDEGWWVAVAPLDDGS